MTLSYKLDFKQFTSCQDALINKHIFLGVSFPVKVNQLMFYPTALVSLSKVIKYSTLSNSQVTREFNLKTSCYVTKPILQAIFFNISPTSYSFDTLWKLFSLREPENYCDYFLSTDLPRERVVVENF
jgi:hypothetical protein